MRLASATYCLVVLPAGPSDIFDGFAHQPESEGANLLVNFLPLLIWIIRLGMSHVFIDVLEAVHLVERASIWCRVQVEVVS